MALLKNWQSLLSAAVGCAGDAGAHHIEAVEGGFERFFALLQSFGRSFHAGRASGNLRSAHTNLNAANFRSISVDLIGVALCVG
jgi:hypothetical protein